MTYEDILISQHPEHQKLWDDFLNMCLLQGLSDAFNKLLENVDNLSESELSSWLSKQNMDELQQLSHMIKCSTPNELSVFANVTESKSTIYVLPLSLENNSTIAGTRGILNEFGRMFSIQSNQTKE